MPRVWLAAPKHTPPLLLWESLHSGSCHDMSQGLLFSSTQGMAKESTTFYQKLASLTAEKTSQPYSSVMEWMRCCLSFVFLRTSILCIHGTRSSVFEPRGQFDPRGQFNPQGQFNPRGQFDTRCSNRGPITTAVTVQLILLAMCLFLSSHQRIC